MQVGRKMGGVFVMKGVVTLPMWPLVSFLFIFLSLICFIFFLRT